MLVSLVLTVAIVGLLLYVVQVSTLEPRGKLILQLIIAVAVLAWIVQPLVFR